MKLNTASSILSAAAVGLLTFCNPAQAQTQMGKKYQPFDVKPGLWQTTSNFTIAGDMPIPAGMLDKMTPEQRARAEAAMKANMGTKTYNTSHCVTKENLQNPFSDKQCTWTLVESTGSKAKGNVSCEEQGIKLTGTGEFEALDSEHMKGSAHMVTTGGGRSMTTDDTFTSKWMGADCKGEQ